MRDAVRWDVGAEVGAGGAAGDAPSSARCPSVRLTRMMRAALPYRGFILWVARHRSVVCSGRIGRGALSIFRFRTAVWFTLVTFGYLYAAGAVALGWWPVGTSTDPEVGVWFYCGVAGGLGAMLDVLRGSYWSIGLKGTGRPVLILDPSSTWWYAVRPVAGSLLGLVGYVAVRLALSPLNVPAPVDERSTLPFIAIAFVAGFALMRILEWRDRTVDELLGERIVGGFRVRSR